MFSKSPGSNIGLFGSIEGELRNVVSTSATSVSKSTKSLNLAGLIARKK
ncbi:hypothetical protein N8801_02185 [Alphaproteobacteria bacterium]|nr:hypothetical protein [Alphaproteobacteria bacterium]